MKRLSTRTRRTVEMGGVMAAAGLLAVIGLLPAQASATAQPGPAGSSPTLGTTPPVTTPTLATIPTTSVPRQTGPTTTVKPGRAATGADPSVSIIDVGGNPPGAFSPASLSVHVGDRVTWTNTTKNGVQHTTTSDSAGWDSGILNAGQSFSHTFGTAGTFTYHCNVHPTMHGTIVVAQTVTTTTTTAPRVGGGPTTTVARSQGATTATTSASSALATTGAQSGSLVRFALIALVAGLVAVAAAGRRRVQD